MALEVFGGTGARTFGTGKKPAESMPLIYLALGARPKPTLVQPGELDQYFV